MASRHSEWNSNGMDTQSSARARQRIDLVSEGSEERSNGCKVTEMLRKETHR